MSPADSVVSADSSWDGAAQCSPLYEHIKEIHYWKRDFVTGTGQARGYKQKNKTKKTENDERLKHLSPLKDIKAMKRLGDSNHSQVQLRLLLRQRNNSSIKLDPVSRPLTSSDWLWLFSLYSVDKGEFEWEKQSSCGCCLFFVSYFFRLTKPSCLSRFRAVHLGSWLGLVGKITSFLVNRPHIEVSYFDVWSV